MSAERGGSLDALVARVAAPQLAISLGVLGLLAASVVLVIASAQRQQRLARQQMEFVAAVSHELRTPLAVICSAGENLADGVVAERDAGQALRLARRDGGASSRRHGRARDGVCRHRVGRADAAHADVDVAQRDGRRIRRRERRRAGARRRHATFACAALPIVVGDADALRSAVQNVIGNAVKYSRPGASVDVAFTADEGASQIRVADRGLGIDARRSAAHLQAVFPRAARRRRAGARQPASGSASSAMSWTRTAARFRSRASRAKATTVTIVLPTCTMAAPPRRDARRVRVVTASRGCCSSRTKRAFG